MNAPLALRCASNTSAIVKRKSFSSGMPPGLPGLARLGDKTISPRDQYSHCSPPPVVRGSLETTI